VRVPHRSVVAKYSKPERVERLVAYVRIDVISTGLFSHLKMYFWI
jgi:hypothetical protein